MNKLQNLFQALRESRYAFPLAALAALLMSLVSESGFQTATRTVDSLGRQANARLVTQLLLRSLIDAETGQRGYLLTGQDEYLEPYRAARSRVDESLASLTRYYAAEAAAAALMAQVEKAAGLKMTELAATISLHDQGQEQAWRDLVRSSTGKRQMDESALRLAEGLLLPAPGCDGSGRLCAHSQSAPS